jgi:hypothetical protein
VGIGDGDGTFHDDEPDEPDEGEAYERKQAYEVMLHRT